MIKKYLIVLGLFIFSLLSVNAYESFIELVKEGTLEEVREAIKNGAALMAAADRFGSRDKR